MKEKNNKKVNKDINLIQNNENSDNDSSKKSDTMISQSHDEIDIPLNTNNCNDVINEFVKIKGCSILKYGIKISTEKIHYGYCQTCDVNLMHPICLECINSCHKSIGHKIREMREPGYIRCGCGEKMHKILNVRRNSKLIISRECPYSDWCEKSRLSTLYVFEGKCVCEFCYRICGYEGKGKPLEKEKEMLQVCECEELNGAVTHTDLKKLYKKFEEILSLKSELIFGLNPVQFLNLIFLGKSSYESLFLNFEEMIQSFNKLSSDNLLNLKENFTSTNFYLSLRVFCKVVEKAKNSSLRYYSPELVNKFSFNLMSNLLNNIIFQDTPIFWNFLSGMLFLYRKINIGYNTMYMGKYKLLDLENLSPLLRKSIMAKNNLLFPESAQQIPFFINFLNNLLKNEIRLNEAYDVFIQVCEILKRLSGFYLLNNVNMTMFCFSFEEMFEFFKKQSSYKKQIDLFYIITKMFNYFIYCYNDNNFYSFIRDNKTDDITNVTFVFYKNQLGCLITRHIIRILYYIMTVMKYNQLAKEEKNKCSIILNLGTKILSLLLGENDSYFINNIEGYKYNNSLLQLLLLSEKDEKIDRLSEQIHSIETIYLKYYTFDADNRDIIRELSNSLDKIINMAKNNEIRLYIVKTNYFYILCKILYIIKYNEEFEEQEDLESFKKLITNIFIFLHYFVEGNEDNALLIYSHYILYALLKLPDDYLLDIFKLYMKCTELILKNKGVICNPLLITETLFDYLINYKNNSKAKWNKEATDFFVDDVKIIDQIIFFFLNIVIKIFLQMKLLYPSLCLKNIKRILLTFMENFEYISLINYNACLLLILVNKLFDSSDQTERETITKLIPLKKLIYTLEDTNILIDLRTEILIFIEKYHASLCFKQNDIPKKNLPYSNDFSPANIRASMHKNAESIIENKLTFNVNSSEKKKKIMRSKTKKKIYITSKNITKVKINVLFSLNNEEPLRNNYYLNAIGQDGDIFDYLKNSSLITNYQFPTRYLSFNYYLQKNQETKNTKLKEIFDLFEEELRKFKDIHEKNLDNINKIIKYYVKGIILPICPIIKRVFCRASDCSGNVILRIYEIVLKMMYLKNLVIENNNVYLNERKHIEFENFDLNKYLDKNNLDLINDYFTLKERKLHSPFDFTYLWEIFDKHFLEYIKYPDSMNLEENFPLKEVDYLMYGKLSEEIDILEEIYINLRKKSGNSIIKKGMTKGNKNILLINDNKTKKFTKKETFLQYQNSLFNKNNEQSDNSEEQRNVIKDKIKKIFDFYCKEKCNPNINMSSLMISLPELCAEYEVNFRKMLLCILINLPGEGIEYDLTSKIILYKLLSLTTTETQSDIIDIMGGKDIKEPGFLLNLCNSMYFNIIKFFLDDFNFNFVRSKSIQINIFCIAKILKLLCEEHNNFFQEKLSGYINYYFFKLEECAMNFTAKSKFFNQTDKELDENNSNSLAEESMSFFNFMVNTLHKFLLVSNKSRNQNHVGFIYDLFYSIIELLVEIIQGNKKELLSKIKTDNAKNKNNNMTLFTFKTFVSLDAEVLFNDTLISGPGFKTRLLLISFFIALLEEKTNKELQKIIMKFLTLNKVLDSINFTMKNYFNEQTKDDPKFKNYYSDYNEKQIIQREFIFDHNIYAFFKHHYFHSEVSKVSKEFKLANNYYKYIKKISINEKSPEAKDLIKKIEKLSESEAKKKFALFNKKIIKNNDIAPINLTNEKEKSISISYIEHYYIIKFFESITKVVEIRLPQEHRNVSVIFTVPCEMIHLTEMTKEEFVHNVDRTNENSKKCELVRNLPLFQLEIEYFKNIKVNFIQRIILSIDFIYIQILMYLYATIFLIIMLFTLEGYKQVEPVESDEGRRRLYQVLAFNNTRKLIEIPSYITSAIDESISKYGLYYDFINYGFVTLNGLFIVSWIAVKMPLYFIFDKFQYMEENKIQKEEDLTIINKIYISIINTMIGRDYINSLLYMFIISLIGAIMKRGEIIYAFFLLAIVDLNQTLKGIAISIKAKGPDLLSSFLFLVFIVYFYTNVGFFFLNDNFAADIENDIPDNYCLCLSFCFLTNFDAGIRARGGAADQMIRISFERNTALYLYRLLYDITYFLICIIIMIDLIFGIILGTFSEKREEERKHDNDKINHCFICHITREIIEKKREDFQVHREQKHYLWNYVEYMIFLNFSRMHELNAFNSFAKTNLDKKNICFLPSAQDDFEKGEITQEIIQEKENEEPEENSEDSSDYENTERIEDNLIEEN